MGIAEILALAAQLLPSVVSLMADAEHLIQGDGKGADKKTVVMNTVTEVAKGASTAAETTQAVLPVISTMIDTFAAIFNTHNIWPKGSAALAKVAPVLQVAEQTAAEVKQVADSLVTNQSGAQG